MIYESRLLFFIFIFFTVILFVIIRIFFNQLFVDVVLKLRIIKKYKGKYIHYLRRNLFKKIYTYKEKYAYQEIKRNIQNLRKK